MLKYLLTQLHILHSSSTSNVGVIKAKLSIAQNISNIIKGSNIQNNRDNKHESLERKI